MPGKVVLSHSMQASRVRRWVTSSHFPRVACEPAEWETLPDGLGCIMTELWVVKP